MPEIILPVDELFTINFNKNGGKFIYCDSEEELETAFINIIKENSWQKQKALCFKTDVEKQFSNLYSELEINPKSGSFFLTNCEYLIARDGSILVSSNQINEKKLSDLPDTFVVFATTSQLVKSISEGLTGIKNKQAKAIPTNITSIKSFRLGTTEKNFLNCGRNSKALYLLLLEDL